MTPEGRAVSDGNPPFLVIGIFLDQRRLVEKSFCDYSANHSVNFRPWILQRVTQCMTSGLTALLALHRPCAQ